MAFALLGISDDLGAPGFPIADYTKSVNEIIHEVAKYLYHVDMNTAKTMGDFLGILQF